MSAKRDVPYFFMTNKAAGEISIHLNLTAVIIGRPGSGKSGVMYRLTTGTFTADRQETGVDFVRACQSDARPPRDWQQMWID